ncbi:SRPBCC family protein [Nonomuraea sp. NPDC049421]|uniref:SRPBCC family protein n=1 Tax=Nonomuraea sp. NPDC049421 TaxID=3155275 RepID=UPI00343CF6BD
MKRFPTGKLFRADDGVDLVLTRTFRAPAEDVWASVTEPERTARWFGPWEGEAGPGRTIRVQLVFEEKAPWAEMRIEACEPPRRLEITAKDTAGSWHLELLLSEADSGTELRFVQHLASAEGIGEIGPGWEYYLDLLAASHDGSAKPEFDDYYPALKSSYEHLTVTEPEA